MNLMPNDSFQFSAQARRPTSFRRLSQACGLLSRSRGAYLGGPPPALERGPLTLRLSPLLCSHDGMAPKAAGRRTANNDSKKQQQNQNQRNGKEAAAATNANGISAQDVTINSSRDEQPPLLLILRFEKAVQQHAALARIEAFYEAASSASSSSADKEEKKEASRYLSMKEAADERICRNYEGFNFPVSALLEWLQAMRDAVEPAHARADAGVEHKIEREENGPTNPAPFWLDYCNEWEVALLKHLASVGVAIPGLEVSSESSKLAHLSLEADDQPATKLEALHLDTADGKLGPPASSSSPSTSSSVHPPSSPPAPRYIISTLSSSAALSTVLAHEKQHALFFLNTQYAAMCRAWFPVDAKLVESACGKAAAEHVLPPAPPVFAGTASQKPKHTSAIQRTIAYELSMRSYAPHVWADEWQAYLSVPEKLLDEREFGNKAREEVREVASFLRRESERAWVVVRAKGDDKSTS